VKIQSVAFCADTISEAGGGTLLRKVGIHCQCEGCHPQCKSTIDFTLWYTRPSVLLLNYTPEEIPKVQARYERTETLSLCFRLRSEVKKKTNKTNSVA
jgi:hypothetical protein